MNLRNSILLLLLFVIAFPVFSQEFYFKNLTKKEGLADNVNFFFFKDSKKLLWISSVEGLNRYDGQSVKIYRNVVNDSTSIMDNNIQSALIEDSTNDLWFSVSDGLIRYNRMTDDFTNFLLPIELRGCYLAFMDTGGIMWLLVDDHLVYTFNPNESKWSFKFKIKKMAHRMACSFPKDPKKGKLIFYSVGKKGMLIYDSNGSEYLIQDDKNILRNCSFQAPKFLNDDLVLMVSNECGVMKMDLKEKEIHFIDSKISGFEGIELLPDSTYLLINNTAPFFYKLELDQNKIYPIPQSSSIPDEYLFNGELRKSYLDSDDILWLSEDRVGISFSKVKPSIFIKSHSDMIEGGVKGIFKGKRNKNILIDGRINSYSLDYTFNNLSTDVQVDKPLFYYSRIFSDEEDKIWAFSKDCIVTIKNSKIAQYPLEFSPLYSEYLDDDKILVSTFEGGIYQMDIKNRTPIFEINTIPSDDRYPFLYKNNRGQLLAFNTNSINFLDLKENFKKVNSIPFKGIIFDCYEEVNGGVWLATDKGLAKIDDKLESIELPNSENKFPEFFIKSIIGKENKNGVELWLTSDVGITKYSAYDSTSVLYGEMDGVPFFDFFPRSKLKDENGRIWFGGKNGVIHFHPDSIVNNEELPEILIKNLLINDEPDDNLICQKTNATSVSELKNIVLPKEKNTITFQFNAIDYVDPERTKLRSWLKGHDKDWVNLSEGESGFARYANLKAGNYIFEIASANSMGVWNPRTKEVELKILPHFTETLWFKILMLSVFLSLGYLLYRFRLSQALEKEILRTKAAENKMEALRSQMNPHFIFNSLNSINSYILSNDIKPASSYVGKFAKLMRMILDNSKESAISLEKEIVMLKLYADVERLRFKDPFEFEINLDDNVDDFGTEVPPMMLQPFVENSIWHGIANKKDGKGKISINISEEGSLLKCIIEDNGIGRAASALIKKQKGRSHQSRALEITKERLSILSKGKAEDSSIVFEDLKNDEGQSSGTRATIIIPLNI